MPLCTYKYTPCNRDARSVSYRRCFHCEPCPSRTLVSWRHGKMQVYLSIFHHINPICRILTAASLLPDKIQCQNWVLHGSTGPPLLHIDFDIQYTDVHWEQEAFVASLQRKVQHVSLLRWLYYLPTIPF